MCPQPLDHVDAVGVVEAVVDLPGAGAAHQLDVAVLHLQARPLGQSGR
jgi:hypothetical protein